MNCDKICENNPRLWIESKKILLFSNIFTSVISAHMIFKWLFFVFPHSILKDFNALECGGRAGGVVGEEMGGGIKCGCGREPQPSSKSAELRVHNWEVNYAPHPHNIYWYVLLYHFWSKIFNIITCFSL